MAGSCAICLQPITDGTKFVVAGTEVFHRGCVAARGTRTSIGNRRHQRLIALEAENMQLRDQAARAEAAEAEVRRLREQLETSRKSFDVVTRDRDRLIDNEAEYRRQRNAALRERDEANAARDAARRELALMQQLAQSQASPPASEDPARQDEAQERFRLLELD